MSTLFKHQSKLPSLPVPTLDETCKRYLDTCQPLLSSADYQKTLLAVEEFKQPGGVGNVLQQRLVDKSILENSKGRSWLIDWWNDYAYMSYRDPLVIFVSYFFAFKDDKLHMKPSSRAASIISGAMEFRKLVLSETLEPDMAKSTPLCSEQYRFLFNSTRIPKIPSDVTRVSDPASNNHIVVIRKNKFYTFDLIVNGQQLTFGEIQLQIERIYQMAGNSKDLPIGILTAENRDTWTNLRDEMLKSPINRASLDAIETAIFVVCLDDTKPVTKSQVSRGCWHGDGRNRFFDKSLQFIIFDNGKAGFLGEHSMTEATPTSRMCDFICEGIDLGKIKLDETINAEPLTPFKQNFELNPVVLEALPKAEKSFDELIKAHDLRVVVCSQYGKGLIKKFAVSPDAYAQMVIQLAYFKMYGVCKPTYESAQTKKFKWGRTETCRSVSNESVAWVKSMADPSLPVKIKGELGRKAIQSQSSYISKAVEGFGVDRHLLGLRLLVKPEEPTPSIFKDPAYAYTSHWNISSSQITSEYYDGYGWGEVVPDGYGIAYMVKENSLCFNLVSRHLSNEILEHYLQEAMDEMKIVFEATIPIKAKLDEIKTLKGSPSDINLPYLQGKQNIPESSHCITCVCSNKTIGSQPPNIKLGISTIAPIPEHEILTPESIASDSIK